MDLFQVWNCEELSTAKGEQFCPGLSVKSGLVLSWKKLEGEDTPHPIGVHVEDLGCCFAHFILGDDV